MLWVFKVTSCIELKSDDVTSKGAFMLTEGCRQRRWHSAHRPSRLERGTPSMLTSSTPLPLTRLSIPSLTGKVEDDSNLCVSSGAKGGLSLLCRNLD